AGQEGHQIVRRHDHELPAGCASALALHEDRACDGVIVAALGVRLIHPGTEATGIFPGGILAFQNHPSAPEYLHRADIAPILGTGQPAAFDPIIDMVVEEYRHQSLETRAGTLGRGTITCHWNS